MFNMGATLWVYRVPSDIGYDSCRSRRELPEYIKNARNCLKIGKKWYFYGVKNRIVGKQFIFSDFWYFKGLTGPYVMKKRGHCDRELS